MQEENTACWKYWCRFCARVKSAQDDEFLPLENLPDVVQLVQRLCSSTNMELDDVPSAICGQCLRLTNGLNEWAKRCTSVNRMFDDLRAISSEEDDKDMLRKKYGLDENIDDSFEMVDFEDNSFNESSCSKDVKVESTADTEGIDEEMDHQDPIDEFDQVGSSSYQRRTQHTVHKPTFKCKHCPKTYKMLKHFEQHSATHQSSTHKCSLCPKTYHSADKLANHTKHFHPSAEPATYVCEECGKVCATNGSLKEHRIVHSDAKPFKCAFCPKSFKNMPRLRTHEDIHNATQYICPHCGLQLNTKITLKMHLVVHSDKKQYKCEVCGNEYKRVKALKAHLILHSGLRPYSCPWCEKTFANGSNCRKHKKMSHPVELAALEAAGIEVPVTIVPKLDSLRQI